MIADLNPVLRGWGHYFRTGNAADYFTDVDAYVERRLRGLRFKRDSGRPAAGRLVRWDRPFFETWASPPARNDSVPGGCVMPAIQDHR